LLFNSMKRQMKGIIIVIAAAMVITGLYIAGGAGLFRMGSNPVIAKVNGEAIDVNMYQQYYDQMLQEYKAYAGNLYGTMMESLKYETLDYLIRSTLIIQEAKKAKIKVSPEEIEDELNNIKALFPDEQTYRKRLSELNLTEKELKNQIEEQLKYWYIQEKQVENLEVTEEEIIKAYEKVTARHILVNPEDYGDEQSWEAAHQEALSLIARIQNGEDFATLAEEFSDDPGSALAGGDLGQFGRGEMIEPFEQAAFSTPVGQITTEPVKTSYGYHIIEVLDRLEAEGEQYLNEKDALREQLLQEKANEVIDQWVYQLKQNAKIAIYDPMLKGHHYLYQRKLDEAMKEYEKAIKEDPDNPYPHVFMASIYDMKADQANVIEQYKLAAEKNINDPEIYTGLGWSYYYSGEEDLAVETFLKASELVPYDYYTQATVMYYLSQIGRDDVAGIVEERINSIIQLYQQPQTIEEYDDDNYDAEGSDEIDSEGSTVTEE
jgi:parvulin-like peptidyl-prolyl isomerase